MIIRTHAHSRAATGFSLIEVMIAVVVLATGLLALAALQGSLTRASSEAKVRGRVAAMLTARLDELRMQSASLTDGTTSTPSTNDPCADGDATDWVDCARAEASLGSLTVSQQVQSWSGDATFTQSATTDPDLPQFKRIILTATWTGADNSAHTLTSATDVSAYSLVTSLIPPPDDSNSGGQNPIVRQDSPVTAGVIPIALGNGQSSAASNPTPELVGNQNNQQIVGTRFNVLTYVPEITPRTSAVIQRRFENDLIKCSCQYGASLTGLSALVPAQWPAVWTGQRYDLAEDANQVPAPGQALPNGSGARSGVTQSALCQECCRDHHDSVVSSEVKFDPERSDASVSKYNPNGAGILVQVPDTNSAAYVNSCRVIRVDGFWRVASDMYSRQFGLLETQSVANVQAKTGLPTTAATDAYTQYVKDYAAEYENTVTSTGNAPGGSQAMFDDAARGLNGPTVTIASVTSGDYRYVHGRGLYIDHLEEDARQKIQDVLADTDVDGQCPTGTPVEDCILPYLPFTTINLTEIAQWLASDSSILTINSGNLLATDPTEPSGGRTEAAAVGTADNTGSLRNSNSGVAVSIAVQGGVDPTDASSISSDAQEFEVGGVANAGPSFNVRVTGGGANPFVFYTLGANVNVECTKPAGSDHLCVTATGTTMPQSGTVRLSRYWQETSINQSVTTAVCDGTNATDTIAVPRFHNYAVTAAAIGATNGTISASVSDNTMAEYTDIAFGSIAANDLVQFTLAEEGGSPTTATISSCTTNGGHNKLNNVLWNKPWCPILAGNPTQGCRS